jgi:hypothetical protein
MPASDVAEVPADPLARSCLGAEQRHGPLNLLSIGKVGCARSYFESGANLESIDRTSRPALQGALRAAGEDTGKPLDRRSSRARAFGVLVQMGRPKIKLNVGEANMRRTQSKRKNAKKPATTLVTVTLENETSGVLATEQKTVPTDPDSDDLINDAAHSIIELWVVGDGDSIKIEAKEQ